MSYRRNFDCGNKDIASYKGSGNLYSTTNAPLPHTCSLPSPQQYQHRPRQQTSPPPPQRISEPSSPFYQQHRFHYQPITSRSHLPLHIERNDAYSHNSYNDNSNNLSGPNSRVRYSYEVKCITAQYFFDHLFVRDTMSDKRVLFTKLRHLGSEEKVRHRLRNLRDRHTKLCIRLLRFEYKNPKILVDILSEYVSPNRIPREIRDMIERDYRSGSGIGGNNSISGAQDLLNEPKDEDIITEICYREVLGHGFIKNDWHTTGQGVELKKTLAQLRIKFQEWVDSIYGEGVFHFKDPQRTTRLRASTNKFKKIQEGSASEHNHQRYSPAPISGGMELSAKEHRSPSPRNFHHSSSRTMPIQEPKVSINSSSSAVLYPTQKIDYYDHHNPYDSKSSPGPFMIAKLPPLLPKPSWSSGSDSDKRKLLPTSLLPPLEPYLHLPKTRYSPYSKTNSSSLLSSPTPPSSTFRKSPPLATTAASTGLSSNGNTTIFKPLNHDLSRYSLSHSQFNFKDS